MNVRFIACLISVFIVYLISILLGIYAIKRWRIEKLDRNAIIQKLGFSPFISFQLILGLIIGVIIFALIFLTFLHFDFLTIRQFSWTRGNLIWTILYFAFFVIIEELIFRSFIINGLKLLTKSTALALIVSSILFSIGHWFNEGSTILSAVSSFIGGLMYGYAFIKTQKLWLPFGLHFTWNFFQGYIFGFPVSGKIIKGLFEINISGNELWTGGVYGPEGGLIGIIARIIVIMAIWLTIKNKYGR